MSIYGKHSQWFLESTTDFEYINAKLQQNSSKSYQYLLSYEYIIPQLTTDLRTFVNTFQTNYFGFLDQMLQKQGSKNIGYNQVNIRQLIIGDYTYLLDKVHNKNILKILYYANNIHLEFSKNYSYFMDIQPIYLLNENQFYGNGRLYYDYLYQYDYKLPFEHLFKFQVFHSFNYNKSCFLNVILHNVLRQSIPTLLFSAAIGQYFDDNIDTIMQSILNSAVQYLEDNIERLTDEFYQFVVNNNLFIFTNSNYFKDHVRTTFKDYLLDDIIPVLTEQLIGYTLYNSIAITNTICSYYSSYIAYKTLIDDVYIGNTLNYFNADLNYLLALEETLYSQLTNTFQNEYSDDLNQIQYVITQYKDYPLFYINSQLYSHYLWISYLKTFNNYKSFYLPNQVYQNESDIMNLVHDHIELDDINSTNITTILKSKFEDKTLLTPVLKAIFSDSYIRMLTDIINNHLTDTIIQNLLPNLQENINDHIYFNYNKPYAYVDYIKTFLTNMLSEMVLTHEGFQPVSQQLVDDLFGYVDSTIIANLEDDFPKHSLETQSDFNYNYFEFFNYFFISSRTAQYINDYMIKFEVKP